MYEYQAVVVSIHDGDTVTINLDLGFDLWYRGMKVRLRGINAPELGTPSNQSVAGQASTLALGKMLGLDLSTMKRGRSVFNTLGDYVLDPAIQPTIAIRTVLNDWTEKYGRTLGEVWLGQVVGDESASVNAQMLAGGYAVPMAT